MRNNLSNDKRLELLVKPLHLFLAQDVEADSQTKLMIAAEWAESRRFYVAQLLSSSHPLAFLNVHIVLRANGFQPAQLARLRHILPEIEGSDENGCLAHYKEMKPKIYGALGANAALWADLTKGSLVEDDNKIEVPHRVFSVHFEESDLEEEGIDMALAERLFDDSHFRTQLSGLIRNHADRLKDSPDSQSY